MMHAAPPPILGIQDDALLSSTDPSAWKLVGALGPGIVRLQIIWPGPGKTINWTATDRIVEGAASDRRTAPDHGVRRPARRERHAARALDSDRTPPASASSARRSRSATTASTCPTRTPIRCPRSTATRC